MVQKSQWDYKMHLTEENNSAKKEHTGTWEVLIVNTRKVDESVKLFIDLQVKSSIMFESFFLCSGW